MGIHREESPSWVCSVGCPRCSEARPRHPGGSVGATHIHGITQADIANAPVFTEVRRRLSDCCQAAGVRQSQAHAALGDLEPLLAASSQLEALVNTSHLQAVEYQDRQLRLKGLKLEAEALADAQERLAATGYRLQRDGGDLLLSAQLAP